MTERPDFLLRVFWGLRLGSRAYLRRPVGGRRLAPGARRDAGRLLERSAERGLGVVAHLPADRGDLGAALGQQVGRDLHAPLGQVLHRRLAHQLGEPLGHVGSRRGRFARQLVQRPGMAGPGMEQRQHPAHHFVAEAGQPAGLSLRQVLEIAAQHLDEHQLRQPGEDRVGAGPAEPGLLGQLAGEAAEPGARHATHVQPARERGEQGIERPAVAAEKTADERCAPVDRRCRGWTVSG